MDAPRKMLSRTFCGQGSRRLGVPRTHSDRSQSAALPEPLTVAYHDACHLAHAQGIRKAPRALLSAVPNLRVVEIPDGDTCCGSAGLYNVEHPDIANELGARKAEAVRATGAQAVAAGNIGCLVQIDTHLRRAGAGLPVLHTMQLLDRALRTPER